MAGMGLVADYGSSSDDDADNCDIKEVCVEEQKKAVNYFESISDETKTNKKVLSKKEVLANPLRKGKLPKSCVIEASSSVFYNPFQKDQEAKKAVLEKHVKLTTNPKDVIEINGKKICWNYRKGRCKFGHNCKYAHDSDLIGEIKNQESSTNPSSLSNIYNLNLDSLTEEEQTMRKRKPGLSEGLIPNKKSRKRYGEIQSKERPWLCKR